MLVFLLIIALIAVVMWYLRKQSMSGGRDFDNGGGSSFMPYINDNKKEDAQVVLKESPSGYLKTAVLLKLDAYNALMVSLEEGNVTYSDAVDKLNTVKNLPMSKAQFGHKGFDVNDVNIYIAGLEAKIEKKIDELR
ncbi:MAG TPA: hypothetical protein P5191_09315 [Ruminococcus sp.]|nr:hypothetical protein [Ruminococcus sp.]